MKTIHKAVVALALFPLFASCEAAREEMPETGKNNLTITACLGDRTKVLIDGLNIEWTDGDEIDVTYSFHTHGGTTRMKLSTHNGSKGTFTSDIDGDSKDLVDLRAVYEPDGVQAWFSEYGSFNFCIYRNDVQFLGDYNLDMGQMTLYGEGLETIYFKPMTGVFKFSVAEEDICELDFDFKGVDSFGTTVTAAVFDNDTVWEYAPGTSSLRVVRADGGFFHPGEDYYISVLPSDISGITVKAIKAEDGILSYARKSSSSGVSIAAGQLCNLGTIQFTNWQNEDFYDIEYPEFENNTIDLLYNDQSMDFASDFVPETADVTTTLPLPTAFIQFGCHVEDESVAKCEDSIVRATGIGTTSLTVYYPADGPVEDAVYKHTYTVNVNKAVVDGICYVFRNHSFASGGGEILSAFVTEPTFGIAAEETTGWYDYKNIYIGSDVIVGDESYPVAGIGFRAFAGSEVNTVFIAEGVEEIGCDAFNFSNAQQIILPTTINKVDNTGNPFGYMRNPQCEIRFNYMDGADGSVEDNGYMHASWDGVWAGEYYMFAPKYCWELRIPDHITVILMGAISFNTGCYALYIPKGVYFAQTINNNYYNGYSSGELFQELHVEWDRLYFLIAFYSNITTSFKDAQQKSTVLKGTDLYVYYPDGDEKFLHEWKEFIAEKEAALEAGTLDPKLWFKSVTLVKRSEFGGNINPIDDGGMINW